MLLHHTTRDGKRYRDSGQLGAGVDQIITITVDQKDETVRQVDSRGRVTVERFRLAYVDDRYDFLDGDQSLEVQVSRIIQAEPRVSSSRLRLRVGGKATKVDAAVESLLAQGSVADEGTSGNHAFVWIPSKTVGQGGDRGRDRVCNNGVSDCGTERDRAGTGLRTALPCPTPNNGVGTGVEKELGPVDWPVTPDDEEMKPARGDAWEPEPVLQAGTSDAR